MTGREPDGRRPSYPRHRTLQRAEVFARDGFACVYCGTEGTPETLSVDHVQPRVRGGDHSAGNVVTACLACNALKAHRHHAEFLAGDPARWRRFQERAAYVWPRLLGDVRAELERRRRRAGR